jgi:hypothetical protein
MKNSTADAFTDKDDRITKKWFEQFKRNNDGSRKTRGYTVKEWHR